MALLLFWAKVASKRIINFTKTSPVSIIWAAVVICAFIYAFANNHIAVTIDIQTLIVIIPAFVIYSLFISSKNYHVMPVLIIHSKSKYHNKVIYVRFFIKQAVKNNILLLAFTFFTYNSLTDKNYFTGISGITILSIILSFVIMYSKASYMNKKVKSAREKKLKINPVIKSALHDYVTSDFLAMTVICIALFLTVMFVSIKSINHPGNIESHSVYFIFLAIIFSVGFMGIIGSIPNINWKFQAIISPNDYKYHIKRTTVFMGGFFACLLVPFVFTGVMIDPGLLLKYLYCLLVLFFAAIHIAFTVSHILIKTMAMLLVVTITIWVSTLPVVFLPALAVPVFVTMVKAKNEYREWSIL